MNIENQNNERLGLPSASQLQRLMTCPASFYREKQTQIEKQETENQIMGTRIHAVLSGDLLEDELSDSEKFLYKNILYQLKKFSQEIGIEINAQDLVLVEQRLWLFDETGKPILSGQPDLVFRKDENYFIVDYKSGTEFPDVINNWQMRALAVLISDWFYDCKQGFLVIICPEHYEFTRFNSDDIKYWRKEIIKKINWILETPLNFLYEQVNPSCKYCKAIFNCSAFSVATMSKISRYDFKSKEDIEKRIEEIFQKNWNENKSEYNAKLLIVLKTIADVYSEIKDRAKEYLQNNPDCFAGIVSLKEGRKIIKQIERPDSLEQFKQFALTSQVDEKDFAKCLKISLTDYCLAIYNALQKASGKKTVKTVPPKFRDEVYTHLKEMGLIEEEKSKPELEINLQALENKQHNQIENK